MIFDWAGTIVDFGSFAPTSIFVEAFKQGFDFEIDLEEAREPMGLGKWDHIQAVGRIPAVDKRWNEKFGRSMTSEDIDAIYAAFMPLQKAKVADHAKPILNAIEVVNGMKDKGIKIGSCSGYPREVMDVLIPVAADYGYKPDYVVATDDLPQGGRPAPFMALKNVIELLDTPLAESLLFTRGVIFGIFLQIAVFTGIGDRGNDLRTQHRLQVIQFFTQFLCTANGHRCLLHSGNPAPFRQ